MYMLMLFLLMLICVCLFIFIILIEKLFVCVIKGKWCIRVCRKNMVLFGDKDILVVDYLKY